MNGAGDVRARSPRARLDALLTAEGGASPESVLVVVASAEQYAGMPEKWAAAGVPVVRTWEQDGPVVEASPEDTAPVWDAVLLVVADRSELRTVASSLPEVGRTSTVALWTRGAGTPVLVPQRGDWPPLTEVRARRLPKRVGGALTGAWFARPVSAVGFFRSLAQSCVHSRDLSPGGLVVGHVGRLPLPGTGVGAVHLPDVTAAVDPELVVPPDVLMVGDAVVVPVGLAEHPVTGRTPLVVREVDVAPVDEFVWNPVGFRKTPDRPTFDLPSRDMFAGVTEGFVRRARRARGVAVDLDTADPQDVLRLAMSGIVLDVTGAQPRFASAVREALASPVDLDDDLDREGWTLRLRRAVFDHHSTSSWRSSVMSQPGSTTLPAVSVLLVTKRPHELEGAVRTVAAQVGAEIELVVATHGFRADAGEVAGWLGREAVVLDLDQDVLFGEVLNAAAAAASCGVLMKMDDDDWYSPHAVHDLLMARRYSGADVVGMPAEFVHLDLDGIDETVRRNHPVERHTSFVAGGTLTFSAELLRDLGGFRSVRRWVDAQLLRAVRSQGGQVYRTHGLGYVLRRRADGHTWHNDPDSFRSAASVDRTWPGWRLPLEGL